jgi:hypothetical protein
MGEVKLRIALILFGSQPVPSAGEAVILWNALTFGVQNPKLALGGVLSLPWTDTGRPVRSSGHTMSGAMHQPKVEHRLWFCYRRSTVPRGRALQVSNRTPRLYTASCKMR